MITFVENSEGAKFKNLHRNYGELSNVSFQELEAMLGKHKRQGNYIGWSIRDKVTKNEMLTVWAYCPRNTYMGKELYPYRVKSWNIWTNSPELFYDVFGSNRRT